MLELRDLIGEMWYDKLPPTEYVHVRNVPIGRNGWAEPTKKAKQIANDYLLGNGIIEAIQVFKHHAYLVVGSELAGFTFDIRVIIKQGE